MTRVSQGLIDTLPLCVDLDGTIARTNTLTELYVRLLKKHPLRALFLVRYVLSGRAHFKYQLAAAGTLTVEILPYHQPLLEYLREQKRQGRQIFLVTASAAAVAQHIARHLGIFTDVIASDHTHNLKGRHKAAALVYRFGRGRFAYVGNSLADRRVWQAAGEGLVVSSNPAVVRVARQVTRVTKVFAGNNTWRNLPAILRSHQWVKNVLIFLPLITAHQLTDSSRVSAATLAFISFSLLSSSVYLTNDLLDLDADRRHPEKKNRPFAAGSAPLELGIILIPVLIAGSVALSLLLPPAFVGWLVLYLLGTGVYSFYLKRVVFVDVILLAMFYVVRIFAGAAAVEVIVSSWLLAFALFLFLSLAMVKRYTELQRVKAKEQVSSTGRGYVTSDLEPLLALGTASGYLSVLVMALYVSSPEITVLYQSPVWLWLLLPLLAYWIGRVWLLAHRGSLRGDPILQAMRDSVSYLVLLAAIVVFVRATFP